MHHFTTGLSAADFEGGKLTLICVLNLVWEIRLGLWESLPPSAVLPTVALTIDLICVATFGGAPYGRVKY